MYGKTWKVGVITPHPGRLRGFTSSQPSPRAEGVEFQGGVGCAWISGSDSLIDDMKEFC
jgi:hypothetical protein